MTLKDIEEMTRERIGTKEIAALYGMSPGDVLRKAHVQAAHDEKVRLRNAFERAVSTEQTRDMLRDEWQTGLKVSNEFRIRLHKALESGEGIDVLFPLACTCIAAMTGDKTLLGSEVKEKLKARQIRMDDV